jgi:hypothetical protein
LTISSSILACSCSCFTWAIRWTGVIPPFGNPYWWRMTIPVKKEG